MPTITISGKEGQPIVVDVDEKTVKRLGSLARKEALDITQGAISLKAGTDESLVDENGTELLKNELVIADNLLRLANNIK